jgi:hypothetical protein
MYIQILFYNSKTGMQEKHSKSIKYTSLLQIDKTSESIIHGCSALKKFSKTISLNIRTYSSSM